MNHIVSIYDFPLYGISVEAVKHLKKEGFHDVGSLMNFNHNDYFYVVFEKSFGEWKLYVTDSLDILIIAHKVVILWRRSFTNANFSAAYREMCLFISMKTKELTNLS